MPYNYELPFPLPQGTITNPNLGPMITNAGRGYNSHPSLQLPTSFGGQALARGTYSPNAGSFLGNTTHAAEMLAWSVQQRNFR